MSCWAQCQCCAGPSWLVSLLGLFQSALGLTDAGHDRGEKEDSGRLTHLFEGLVVDEARSILWNLELALLDVLAELPRWVLARGEAFIGGIS